MKPRGFTYALWLLALLCTVMDTEHFAELDRFPEGLEFPPELLNRIYYDGRSRRLVYRGFMSKAHFDLLEHLHHDPKFQRAVEELFRKATYEEPREQGRPRTIVVLVFAMAAVVLGVVVLVYLVFFKA